MKSYGATRRLTIWRDCATRHTHAAKEPGVCSLRHCHSVHCVFGANLTIFAVVDSVVVTPICLFPESERLVTLFNSYPKAGRERDYTSLTSYYERSGNIAAFSHLTALMESTAIVGDSGSTERVKSRESQRISWHPRCGAVSRDALSPNRK